MGVSFPLDVPHVYPFPNLEIKVRDRGVFIVALRIDLNKSVRCFYCAFSPAFGVISEMRVSSADRVSVFVFFHKDENQATMRAFWLFVVSVSFRMSQAALPDLDCLIFEGVPQLRVSRGCLQGQDSDDLQCVAHHLS